MLLGRKFVAGGAEEYLTSLAFVCGALDARPASRALDAAVDPFVGAGM